MKTDLQLHSDVMDALSHEPLLDAANIAIDVKQGVVTLRGEVPAYGDFWTAERVTKRVPGVRAIAQELKVVVQRQHVRNDSDIAIAAANVLEWDVLVPNTVTVKVTNGWLTLSGVVRSQFQRRQAEYALSFLAGVRGIANLIVLRASPSNTDVRKHIQQAFLRHAGIDASRVYVEVEGQTVTLRGRVGSIVERDDAVDAAWMAAGVVAVHDEIVIAPELSLINGVSDPLPGQMTQPQAPAHSRSLTMPEHPDMMISQAESTMGPGAVVTLYDTPTQAEAAVRERARTGHDMTRLSIVSKNFHATEDVVGFYNVGDRMQACGATGAFWDGILSLLFGSGFFVIPETGPLLVAGPVVMAIVNALESAVRVGSRTVLGAALFSIGIPKDSVTQYETQIRSGKFLVIEHAMKTGAKTGKIAALQAALRA